MNDPLSAARGIGLGLFASLALILFMAGASLAATGSETAGSVCMVLACASAILGLIIGGNRADTQN